MLEGFKIRLSDDEGQDLVEYVLLLAFISLIAVALFISISPGVATIWTYAAVLGQAGSVASGVSSSVPPTARPDPVPSKQSSGESTFAGRAAVTFAALAALGIFFFIFKSLFTLDP